MKQNFFKYAPSDDMVASTVEIEKQDLEHAISETTCASGDLYKESIDGEVLEAEVFGQSSAISSPINGLEKFLKADGGSRDQIEKEVLGSNNMLFESFEAAQKYIKEMIREYDGRSYVGVETSQEIDSASLDNIMVEKLRERGSLRTQ